jgi:1-pyrroline-5-carboxylate dehydrogenase
MAFRNENTFQKYVNSGNEKLFHSRYNRAVGSVESEFGKTYYMLINGKKASGTKRVMHVSPNNRDIALGYVQQASSKQIKQAIRAAARAFKIWGEMDYRQRLRIFRKIVDLMRRRKFELAAWLSFENGKNRYEAIADVDEAIDFINYYIEEMIFNQGFVLPNKTHARREKNTSIMKPYGVWAIVAPFNFPAAILVGMATGALITGNTVIIKPASDTPIIGYKITEIMVKAGLPSGVVNFITGPGGEIGKLLVESKDIAGIVFTGSREVGYELIKRSSEVRPRPVIAELGGKNAAIVTKTADLDSAVEGVMRAAFSYSAQKCSACSRVYVQQDIKSQFVSKLIKKAEGLVIGNPVKAETFVGPLINSNSYRNFQKYSKLAARDGKILIGGSLKNDKDLARGFYAKPTIVTNLPNNHILFKMELFVPILCVSEYNKFDDALALCNKSEYGLTAGIYTKKKEEIEKFLKEIEAGVVYVNRKTSATTGAMVGRQSFGGWKDSGTTGKGTGGRYYLTQFMREQSQTIVE